MELQNLMFEIENEIGYVTINRPKKLNALNSRTMDELNRLFNEIKYNDEIKVVIVTGAGEKAFVAGADIRELNELDMNSSRTFAQKGQAVFNLIENLGKPVIAAVNGFALGGGCELALACHIRIASTNAIFGQPEVNLGIIPGYGGTQRLARLINTGRAVEYILTGDMIDAKEAFRLGIVNHIYPAEELMEKANEIAGKIKSKGQIAVKLALNATLSSADLNLKEGLNLEANLFSLCTGTKDFKEGTNAFLEKRSPKFTGK